MRNPLRRRHYGPGDLHFVTFSYYRPCPLLASVRAGSICQDFESGAILLRILAHRLRVMPEHIHLGRATAAVTVEQLVVVC